MLKAAGGTEEGGKHLCVHGRAGYITMLLFIVTKTLVYKTINLICITW